MANVINAPTAGIYRKEIDQSNNVAVAGTSAGAIVVRAPMGPVNREVIVSDYPQYTSIFGTPVFSAGTETPTYGYGAYAAEEYLKESTELHVVRAFDATDKYPMIRFLSSFTTSSTASNMTGLSDEGMSGTMTPGNPDTLNTIYALDQNKVENPTDHLMIGALGPGIDDENIGVTIQTFTPSADWMLNYDDYPSFSAISSIINSAANYPTTIAFNNALTAVSASYAVSALFPVALQVVKINVYVKTSKQSWSDINSQIGSTIAISDLVPVETWYGTLGYQKDAKNNQLRLKEIVNGNSQYIYCVVGAGTFPTDVRPEITKILGLGGGAISTGSGYGSSDASNIIQGWEFFRSREYATVNILICPDDNNSIKQEVDNIAATRMDCIGTGQSGNVDAISVEQVTEQESYGYTNPSYIALYAGWDLKYDQANDRNIFVPKALYGAALMARNDRTGNTWDAPAGDPNGILSSSGQNKVFSFTDIGRLGKAGINTSRFLRSTGHTMWSQRTAQIKDTALTRINVRRLLLYIENSVELTLFPFLFNIVNDDKQRLRISTLINDFLGGIRAGGGVTDALAVCSEQNNPAIVIDAEQMVVDMFVTPAKPVEVIQLNTRITKTGVNFTEIIL